MIVEVASTLQGIEAAWDALAGGEDNPFVESAFLLTLERAGAVGPNTGWLPRYLLAREGERLVGAMPLYVRGDSYGEYIFDWGWADAAQRAGIRYYPKLTAAVPFTPATGPRLLGDARPALIAAALELQKRLGASSTHVLFCTPDEHATLETAGWLPRLSMQFHWENAGWRDWQDFAAALTRKRRHEMNRERKQARTDGVEIRVLRGPELVDADWDALHGYYQDTVGKYGQHEYLNPGFWRLARTTLVDRVVAVIATRGGERIAGAFNLHKGKHLYGRYWGCHEEHRALHFEVCYYALIEWCLANGVTRFEAGAQGEHKLQRGFLPSLTYSAHQFAHPGLREAVGRFVAAEAERVRATIAAYGEHSPFKGG